MTQDPVGLPLKGLNLPGGASLLRGLSRLGVSTVGDLLTYLPRRYEDRREITRIADLLGGSSATITAANGAVPATTETRAAPASLIARVKITCERPGAISPARKNFQAPP